MSDALLRVTAELPGSGGRLTAAPEDFQVSELLPYAPSGEGEHLFIYFEKRDLTTPEAARRIASALGKVDGRGQPLPEVGFAGMKDRHAIARQWLSVPWPIKAGEVPTLSLDGITVLTTVRHGHKLRRGHQRGNRFRITLRDVPSGGLEKALVVAERLRTIGVPNYYGPQRFGKEGDNAVRALAFLRNEAPAPRDRRLRDLLVSSLQSEIFNRILTLRISRGLYNQALRGDVMQKHETGGMFVSTDPSVDQARVERLEISPTGVLPGKKAKATEADAAALEAEVLSGLGFDPSIIDRYADGTRRVLRQPLDPELHLSPIEDGLVLEVSLPSGSYATVLLDELVKPEGARFDRSE